MTPEEIVSYDKEKLYIGNTATVDTDLELPVRGLMGSEIVWESSNTLYLENNGIVHRPQYGQENRTVRLTAFLSYKGAKAERTWEVTVLEIPRETALLRILPLQLEAEGETELALPFAVVAEQRDGEYISLPVEWDAWEEPSGKTRRPLSEKEKENAYFAMPKAGDFRIFGHLREKNDIDSGNTSLEPVIFVSANAGKKERPSPLPKGRQPQPGRVRLLEGSPFYDMQTYMGSYLLQQDPDTLLYNFRSAAGLPTKGAEPMSGWDAPACKLKGHTTGHYLSAVAKAWAATGNDEFRERAKLLVRELSLCQEAFGKREGCRKGFLSGYDETQFDLLEQYTRYPEIWAPYYTLHKILAGLLDCYTFAGISMALKTAEKLGLWVYERLGRLSRRQRCRMWELYIAGEFGGMNESMAELFRLTGKREFLEAAFFFDNDKLMVPMGMKKDSLGGLHANQHIPQVIGLMKQFEVTGEYKRYEEAKYFWDTVTGSHIYANGGTGEGEMFQAPGVILGKLSDRNTESCASYNMLKLTGELFRQEQKASYMDYYERTLYNHTLAAGEKKDSGETTYFFPMLPGSRLDFESENSCCHGTGMESPWQCNIWEYTLTAEGCHSEGNELRDAPGHTLTAEGMFVNLFIPSVLEWEEKRVTVTQRYTEDGKNTYLEFSGFPDKGQPLPLTVAIRRPAWASKEDMPQVVQQDETPAKLCCQERDGYILLSGRFAEGDRIFCRWTWSFRLEYAPDRENCAALFYGPLLLAAVSESKDMLRRREGFEKNLVQTGAFRWSDAEGTCWLPVCMLNREAYHIYIETEKPV